MEKDQDEDMKETPNVNKWQRIYSHTEKTREAMEVSCGMLQSPQESISGDSGFHSITPDSAESLQNLNLPTQSFCVPGGMTPKIPIAVNVQPYLPVNSTPHNYLEMMETSMYPEDVEMKNYFGSSDADEFNLNSIDENNMLIFKNEKSTNICSLLNTDKDYLTPNLLQRPRSDCILYKGFQRPVFSSNLGALQDKPVNFNQTLFNTSVENSLLKSSVCIGESSSELGEEKGKINTIDFNKQNFEDKLESINIHNLPSIISPIKANTTSTTVSRLKKKRFLNGIEQVDILYLLGVKENFLHIVKQIFSYLSPYDLFTVKAVSPTWNQIFSTIKPIQKTWKEFRKRCKEYKENMPENEDEYGVLKAVRRQGRQTYLSTIENTPSFAQHRKSSPQSSPVVSPSKRRFHLFHKEAQKLKQGERLLRCPKCTFPSHDPGSTYATCTRVGCKYEFCIFCCGAYSPDHHCPPLYTPRPCKRTVTIGSKGSKRNLRRL